MFSAARFLVLFMVGAGIVVAETPDEVILMDAVIEDFSNRFGDKDDQNAFGAARGVIENGTGKAYLGSGYWYGTADAGSSVISGIDGTTEIKSKITSAIDPTERFLHVIMTTSTSTDEYPYATIGFNLTEATEYIDASNATGFSVTAAGTGTVRFNLITEDYMDAGEDWGFYGFEVDLTAAKATSTVTNAQIEPAEWSYGYENDLTWAADGAKALNKIEIQVKDGEDADLQLYEIKFTGATYGDFGFVKVPVVFSAAGREHHVNGLSVESSRINYSVAQPQHISIDLMNMAGCRVKNLFSGNAAVGSGSVPFNAGSLPGVAPGQYVVQLNGTGFSTSQPVMIAK